MTNPKPINEATFDDLGARRFPNRTYVPNLRWRDTEVVSAILREFSNQVNSLYVFTQHGADGELLELPPNRNDDRLQIRLAHADIEAKPLYLSLDSASCDLRNLFLWLEVVNVTVSARHEAARSCATDRILITPKESPVYRAIAAQGVMPQDWESPIYVRAFFRSQVHGDGHRNGTAA